MNLLRRKLFKTISFYSFFLFFPIKSLYASSKKIINKELSKEQKDIKNKLFEELSLFPDLPDTN